MRTRSIAASSIRPGSGAIASPRSRELAIVPEFRRRHGEQHTAIAVSEADFGEVDLPRSVRPLWHLICEQIWTGFERRGATLH